MFNLISLKNGLENVDGFFFGGVSTGLKANGDNDLGFIRSNEPFMVSAKFTSISNAMKMALNQIFYS